MFSSLSRRLIDYALCRLMRKGDMNTRVAATDFLGREVRAAERAIAAAAKIAAASRLEPALRPLRRHLARALGGTPERCGAADLLRIACFALFAVLLVRASLGARATSRGSGLLARVGLLLDRPPAAAEGVLACLARAAESAARSGVAARQDFLGRLYRKLLLGGEGRHYATYYTSAPAAALLATLVVATPHRSWRFDGAAGANAVTVIDPACGSGTLLAAAHAAIGDARRDRAGPELATFYGWDVLDFATELARATLALLGGGAPEACANIRSLPVGRVRGRIRLGSLDHLRGAGRRHEIVLMNPPFSRSAKPNLTFGFAAPDERRSMQEALSQLAAELGFVGIGRAGIGPYFLLLGAALLAEGGRIGLVVPRSMLSGVSWKKIRARFLDGCEILYIVSNFDPGAPGADVEPWNWSESTAIGEVLIVAEKATGAAARPATFVNVVRKPANEGDARALAHDVIRQRTDRSDAALFRVPQEALRRNWLAPCVFAQARLDRLALDVIDNGGLLALGALRPAIGPDIAQVKRAFAAGAKPNRHPILYGHQGDMTTMLLAPQKLAHGRATAANAASLYRRHAARLLIAERPHLGSEALLAMRAPEPVLATAFWETRLPEEPWETMLLLWLNSSYGVMAFLAHATSSMGDIFKMKKDQLGELPVPDPARIDGAGATRLAARLAGTPFLPYAAEFARAAAGTGPRLALDRFFGGALDLSPLDPSLYAALARDPVVCRQRLLIEDREGAASR
jgi:hypothetical protein